MNTRVFLVLCAFLIGSAGLLLSPESSNAPNPLAAKATSQQTARADVISKPARMPGAAKPRLVSAYRKLPLSFEANRGQTDAQVKFLSRGRGYSLFLTGNEAVLALRNPVEKARPNHPSVSIKSPIPASIPGTQSFPRLLTPPGGTLQNRSGSESPGAGSHPEATVLRMKLAGANPNPQVTGLDELPGKSNYFIGNDPNMWRTNVPNYAKVQYKNVYPGIDVVYYGTNQRQLEHDFLVAPGADPKAIRLAINTGNPKLESGSSKTENRQPAIANQRLTVDSRGDLVIATGGGELRFHKPIVYQPRDTGNGSGKSELTIQNSEFVDGRYRLLAGNQVSFEITNYDRSRSLVIDPVLTYATYLGGSSEDWAADIAVDASGNVYLTGATLSTNFPVGNAFDSTRGSGGSGAHDAFVVKMDPTASSLIYSTYLGGSLSVAPSLATGDDRGYGIAIDAAGSAYLTGSTRSLDFPTTEGAFQRGLTVQESDMTSFSYSTDVFVSKLNTTGSILLYSTYLGGSGDDYGYDIAVDSTGHAFVTGESGPPLSFCIAPCTIYLYLFPLTVGAFDTTRSGSRDPFLAKMFADGSWVVYSTLLGGFGHQAATGIAVDSQGVAYVTGYTPNDSYPTTPQAFDTTYNGGDDVFVTAVNASGSDLVYSTYLGGSGDENAGGIALDDAGNAYIVGDTDSGDFPTTEGAFDPTGSTGSSEVFITKLNPQGSVPLYSTYLGGNTFERGYAIQVDAARDAIVTGYTLSEDFPVVNPVQTGYAGVECAPYHDCFDAFVTTLNDTGTALLFSTLLGGFQDDVGYGIALDSAGNIYITGETWSSDFPVTDDALQNTFHGMSDAFVLKISQEQTLTLQPSSMDFGSQGVGSTSSPETVTVTNNSGTTVNISGIEASGDFAETHTCGSSLAVSTSCTIDVTFTPSATGTRNGDLTITSDAEGSPHTVSLTGEGVVTPLVSLSPDSLDMGSQPVDTTSTSQYVTLSNTGNAVLSITAIQAAEPFARSHDCPLSPSTLAVDASCTIQITFSPTEEGAVGGQLTVTSNAPGSPHSVILTGTGTPPAPLVSLSPAGGLAFAVYSVGTTSPAQPITLTNSGSAALTISSITLSGGQAGNFARSHNCPLSPSTLGADGSCTINVTFTPSAGGPRKSSLLITSDAPGSPHRVMLTGVGTAVSLTPTSWDFGSRPVGSPSAPKAVTLTNLGSAPVHIWGAAITGVHTEDFHQTHNCPAAPAMLGAGGSCTFNVTFAPAGMGAHTAPLTISHDGGGSPAAVSLTGNGSAPLSGASADSARSRGQPGGEKVGPGRRTGSPAGSSRRGSLRRGIETR